MVKKETVTQKMLWECPNCGAPRVGEEKNCRFCGSALVAKTVVTEEMTKEGVDRQFIIDNSHPTIVSELKPAWLSEPSRIALLLAGGVFVGFSLWLVYKTVAQGAGLLSAVVVSLAAAALFLALAVVPVVKYRRFLKSAPEYEAAVVSVDKRLEPVDGESFRSEPVEFTTMTVLFTYEGKKVFGLFRVSNKIGRGTYGKGEKVKIRVNDGKIALSEG